MSTSAERINNLIGAYTNLKAYFDAYRANLDSDAAAVLAQLSTISRTFYVKQSTGLDTNIGTIDAPLASITRAAELTPRGGQVTVILMEDYTTTRREVFEQQFVSLTFQGAGARANLYVAPVDPDDPATIGDISTMIGSSFCTCSYINFHLQVAADGTNYRGLFRNRGRTAFRFFNCEFTVDVGANMSLVHNELAADLYFEDTNNGLSHVAGHFVDGVAAGTDPAAVFHVRATNLSTL